MQIIIIASQKSLEAEKKSYDALVKVFQHNKRINEKSLELIANATLDSYAFNQFSKFAELDTLHIESLITNQNTHQCYDLEKLFLLKYRISQINIVLPSLRKVGRIQRKNRMTLISDIYGSEIIAKEALQLYSQLNKLDKDCL